MTERLRIEHVATGGTIDSIWSPEQDGAIPAPASVVAEYLGFLSTCGDVDVDSYTLMMKDSREITIADKDLVAKRVAESHYTRSLVTSGTYLMREIGERIQRHDMAAHFDRFDHRVVLTSSLRPMDGFMMSDGGFNIGMSIAALHNEKIPAGVIGVANGMIAPIHLFEKDLTTATFESLDSSKSLLGYDEYTLLPAGGTIDFEVNGTDGIEPADDSAIPNYVRNHVRSNINFSAVPPILKDSRKLTQQDMDTIVDILKISSSEHIVVTAGLIRMAELRKVIESGLGKPSEHEHKIILTGSKYPLRTASFSDAPFNLGYALGTLGDMDPGVRVAVGGKLLFEHEDPLSVCYYPEELDHLLDREEQ